MFFACLTIAKPYTLNVKRVHSSAEEVTGLNSGPQRLEYLKKLMAGGDALQYEGGVTEGDRCFIHHTLLVSTKLRRLHVDLNLKLEAGVLEGDDDRNGGYCGIMSTALENPKVIYEVRLQRGQSIQEGLYSAGGIFSNTLNADKCIWGSLSDPGPNSAEGSTCFWLRKYSFAVVRQEGHYCFLALATASA